MKPKFNFGLAGALLLLCALAIAVFRVMKELGWLTYLIVLIIYGAVSLVVALWYVFYNRGLIGKKVTDDLLPPTMPKEQRDIFISEINRRRQKSKWAMLVLIPMIATFFFEAIEIYMLPSLFSSFGK